MKIVVGLGNPGKQYFATRHNIGFLALDTLQETFAFPDFQEKQKFQSSITEGFIGDHRTILVKPQTYMNLSGEAVTSILDFYKLPLKDLCILHDDIDLVWGEIRYTNDSRSAGHRGVQNIIDHVGTKKFPRIRIGMGPKPSETSAEKFVLTPFTKEETHNLVPILANIAASLSKYLDE